MKIVIAGGTGFIGKAICGHLAEEHEVIALSRDLAKGRSILGDAVEVIEWDAKSPGPWQQCLEGADAVVNLAGVNIGSARWTDELKQRILSSRINSTQALFDAVQSCTNKPGVFVLSSAVGFYGCRGDELLDENSNTGEGFLPGVCRDVEGFAHRIEAMGVRPVVIRTGFVIGAKGGGFEKMILPFRFFMGGWLASGQQWMSWISLADEVRAIQFLIERQDCRGVYNLTAPYPVRNREFFKTVGKEMHRPCWAGMPGFVLAMLFGEMAGEVFLASQRVIPHRLMDAGFEFNHPQAKDVIHAALSK